MTYKFVSLEFPVGTQGWIEQARVAVEGLDRQRRLDEQARVAVIKGDLRKAERRISDLEAAVFRLENMVTVALDKVEHVTDKGCDEKAKFIREYRDGTTWCLHRGDCDSHRLR